MAEPIDLAKVRKLLGLIDNQPDPDLVAAFEAELRGNNSDRWLLQGY